MYRVKRKWEAHKREDSVPPYCGKARALGKGVGTNSHAGRPYALHSALAPRPARPAHAAVPLTTFPFSFYYDFANDLLRLLLILRSSFRHPPPLFPARLLLQTNSATAPAVSLIPPLSAPRFITRFLKKSLLTSHLRRSSSSSPPRQNSCGSSQLVTRHRSDCS